MRVYFKTTERVVPDKWVNILIVILFVLLIGDYDYDKLTAVFLNIVYS